MFSNNVDLKNVLSNVFNLKGVVDNKEIVVRSGLYFDAHLFSLVIPILFIIFLLIARKRIVGTSPSVKFGLAKLSGITMIILFVVSLYDYGLGIFRQNSNFELITIFYNIDSLLLIFLGFAMVLNRLELIRIFTPLSIIIGFANLINNPGTHITYTAVAANAFLCTLPLYVTLTKVKVISFKGLVASASVSVLLLTFVAVFNTLADSGFSLISAKLLSKNKFYEYIPANMVKIILFISLVVFAQCLAWVFINYVMLSKKLSSVIKQVRREISADKQMIVFAKRSIQDSILEFESFEMDLAPDENDQELVLVHDETSAHEYISEYVYNYISVTLPNLNGARSPSL